MSNQPKNNKLNYLIDPTFNKVNRFYVSHFRMKTIEHIFKSIIRQMLKWKTLNKTIKNKTGTCEKIIEMRKNDDYTLYYDYFLNHYKFIEKDLSKQIK